MDDEEAGGCAWGASAKPGPPTMEQKREKIWRIPSGSLRADENMVIDE